MGQEQSLFIVNSQLFDNSLSLTLDKTLPWARIVVSKICCHIRAKIDKFLRWEDGKADKRQKPPGNYCWFHFSLLLISLSSFVLGWPSTRTLDVLGEWKVVCLPTEKLSISLGKWPESWTWFSHNTIHSFTIDSNMGGNRPWLPTNRTFPSIMLHWMSVKSNGLKFVNLLEYLYVYEKIPQGSIDTGDVAVKHQIEVNLLDFPVLHSILLFV